ncbi:hypothetical protein L6R52_40070, partial [Myxococcota bacterium]|nr:hypothetical protein [Myxococcota bacterium]
ALGAFASNVEGHREKQLSRTLEQLHKILGALLDRVEPDARREVTARTLAAAKGLAEKIGVNELLVPALTAAIGLVDASTRLDAKKRLDLGADGAKTAMEEAAESVEALAASLVGRRGVSSALNVFAPLVEQLTLSHAKLTKDDVRGLVRETTAFLRDATPIEGFDLTLVAQLAELVARASNERPQDATAALALAKARFLEDRAGLVAQAKAGLGDVPAELPEPFRASRIAVEQAMVKVLDASPS